MKKTLKVVAAASALLVLAGCGQRVEVPPVHVGKVMHTNGYKEGIVNTSTFRLDYCGLPGQVCEKLVLLDISDFSRTEVFSLFMPKDKLEMDFSLRLTLAPKPEDRERLFGKLPPRPTGIENVSRIPNETGYETYVKPVVKREARDFMSQYSIMEVANNREVVSNALAAHLSEVIDERTPYMAKMVDLDETKYPEVITNAQIKSAERREQIQREEAEKEVNRVRMEKELELAQKQRTIDIERAQAEAEVNRILGDSMTEAYEKYRKLDALDEIARSDNTKFVPVDMLSTMAADVMVGNESR